MDAIASFIIGTMMYLLYSLAILQSIFTRPETYVFLGGCAVLISFGYALGKLF